MKRQIVIPRAVLLVEIERRCALDAGCNAKTRVGLTKDDARLYHGFECERCGRWNEDSLSERDVPEWWEEIVVTDLAGLRPGGGAAHDEDGPGEVVKRLSDSYRQTKKD